MNPQTKCCRNCVHARWKYRELGSVDLDRAGSCGAIVGTVLIHPSGGTGCVLFEPSCSPVTKESKRMKEAAKEVSKLADELWQRSVDATIDDIRSGRASLWVGDSNALRYIVPILEREAK